MRLNLHAFGDDGPVVIGLHGLTGHGRRFRRLAAGLPGRQLLAPDLRGHGRSTYDPPWTTEQHVQDVLDTVPDGPCDWIGFSFGGRIAAAIAAAEPERVRRLVLLDPALTVPPALAHEKARDALAEEEAFASAEEAVDAWLACGLLLSTPRELLEEDVADHYVTRPDGRLEPRVCRAMQVTAWSEMARSAPARVDVPTLLITGDRSWLPVDDAALAPTRHVELSGGHSLLWDALTPATEAVRSFLS